MKKWIKKAALALVLALTLSGCGSKAVVPVVQMRMLTQAGQVEEHFAGVVISENAVEVRRDLSQTIEEICVAEGDTVKQDQVLFRYDSEALKLTLDKQELELDRLKEDVKAIKSQIKDVEKELKKTKDDSLKTQLNLQLRQLQNNLREAEYSQEDLEKEISATKTLLKNVEVKSPIAGTVRSIQETGEVCVVIQQTGAYQVQGSLNELSMNAGIQTGARVTVVSRLDESKTWSGTVVSVDYNSNSSNGYDNLYGGTDVFSGSTNYPFLVALDSTEGLLLGQHVYIRPVGINESGTGRILLPESYVMEISYDDTTMITTGWVWRAGEEGTLIRQQIILGEYVSNLGCYVVLDGLSMESFVADPSNPDCAEGVLTNQRTEEDFGSRTEQTTDPAVETEG